MILHLHKENFKNAIEITSASMEISPIYVEKDYWVTFALFTIFNNEVGKDTIFKGGTALSKCYSMIERFSEDIDLVILRREGESDSKLKSKLKAVSSVVQTVLPEVFIDGITHKMGMNRKRHTPRIKNIALITDKYGM
jgi:predicted nucleotidyltransferase component of viral defense system